MPARRPRRTCWGGCSTLTGRMWPGAGTSPGSPPMRLAVSRLGHRPGLPAPGGLVDERPSRRRPGRERPGRRSRHPRSPAHVRHDLPHRPRRRIQLGRLYRRLPAAGPAPLHEPHRLVPGQRRRRELVRLPQGRAGPPSHYRTRAQARTAIFAWIAWYNRFRLHTTRGYLPPIEWEQRHATISPLPSTIAA
jgi:hypothetical protein